MLGRDLDRDRARDLGRVIELLGLLVDADHTDVLQNGYGPQFHLGTLRQNDIDKVAGRDETADGSHRVDLDRHCAGVFTQLLDQCHPFAEGRHL